MNTTTQKTMDWLNFLPGIGNTDFLTQRDEITAMLAAAQLLDAQAAERIGEARDLRGKAYFASCRLEGVVGTLWTTSQIADAKRRG